MVEGEEGGGSGKVMVSGQEAMTSHVHCLTSNISVHYRYPFPLQFIPILPLEPSIQLL